MQWSGGAGYQPIADYVEIIAELVSMAKDMRRDHERAQHLGFREAEIALYDAIIQNDSAVSEWATKPSQRSLGNWWVQFVAPLSLNGH